MTPPTALRPHIAPRLTALSTFCERNPTLILLMLVVVYLPAAFQASRVKPLWHDELFTYYIAQAPSLRAMGTALRTEDLNPPLVYLLTRLSFRVFGVNTLAARLPEIAGFLVLLIALFRFVRRRMGVLYAAFAVALLLGSKIFPLAVEARPYTLFLGCLGLALAAWQQATLRQQWRSRIPSLLLLSASVAGMLLSHIFALLAFAALLGAEVFRARTRLGRLKIDWPVFAALLLPLPATLTYLPQLRNHAAAIYPVAFQPDGNTIFEFYIGSIDRELICLLLTALAVLILLGPRHLRAETRTDPELPSAWFFTPPEWLLTIALLLAPLLLLLEFMATHAAFFDRYGAVETIGVAILAAVLLCRWTMLRGLSDPRSALLGTVIVLVISGLPAAIATEIHDHTLIPTIANSEPRPRPCEACVRTAALDPSLPLVDTSGLTFLEMNHNESPATLSRLFYLTDARGSRDLAHANIFERMPEIVASFHLGASSVPYSEFIRGHPHFFVFGRYDYPEDWLLRKLEADGAHILVLGRTSDSYRDTELYEVTFAAPPQ